MSTDPNEWNAGEEDLRQPTDRQAASFSQLDPPVLEPLYGSGPPSQRRPRSGNAAIAWLMITILVAGIAFLQFAGGFLVASSGPGGLPSVPGAAPGMQSELMGRLVFFVDGMAEQGQPMSPSMRSLYGLDAAAEQSVDLEPEPLGHIRGAILARSSEQDWSAYLDETDRWIADAKDQAVELDKEWASFAEPPSAETQRALDEWKDRLDEHETDSALIRQLFEQSQDQEPIGLTQDKRSRSS
ncbi:MAG: hypothetical protein AAGB34_11860, partial [Planctomycetota bacterium]